MADDKLIRLVQALSKQTIDGKLTWAPTSSEGVYQVSFPTQSIQIRMRTNRTTSDDVVITLRNAEGTVVESFDDTDLQDSFPDALSVMSDLFIRARRQALGADKAIDDILQALGIDEPTTRRSK